LKIVHVIPALTKGGAERVVVELANHAAADGHDVTVLAAIPAARALLADRLLPGVAQRFVAPRSRRPRSAYAYVLPWILRNRRWLLDQDIVHCHLTFGGVFGALLQTVRDLLRRGRPVVVETYHAVGMKIPALKRTVHAALLRHRDAVALMAEDAYWRAFSVKREGRPAQLIPNGISEPPPATDEALTRYRRTSGIPDRAIVIGTIGRLRYERRPDLLLQAFARLAGIHHNAHFLLGGEGPERERLLAEASRLGLANRVHLPGLVNDPAEPIGIIDLYLTVNVGHTTGVAALEAVFAGVPAFALQLDTNHQRGADDWIPSWSDPDELGAQAATLLADNAALQTLATKQQRHARKNHGIDSMARAYERLYEDALARRGA
jgi:glycosyltransferase involved in cell wall biosynthesis